MQPENNKEAGGRRGSLFKSKHASSPLKKSECEFRVPLLACPAVFLWGFMAFTAGQASSGTLSQRTASLRRQTEPWSSPDA